MLWPPTVATDVSVGRLRKMSPIPQIPKVTIRRANRPLTTMDPALERIAWSMEAAGLSLWPGQVDPPDCRCDRTRLDDRHAPAGPQQPRPFAAETGRVG